MKTILFPLVFFLLLMSGASAQSLSGVVRSVEGEPLPNATVRIPETQAATFTDLQGRFSLSLADVSLPADLVISFLGYETATVPISEALTDIQVQLKVAQANLNEVVVVGYGDQEEKFLTSSVEEAEGEKLYRNVSVPNFQSGLQGRIPGLTITQSSGAPESGVVMRIRGVSSITGDNQPLFVVDGLIITDDIQGEYWGNFSNPLLNINPNDIESVTVMKSAAASAIYGSRGANGVILITTKRGDYGARPTVNLGYYTGFQEPTNLYETTTGPEYAQLWNWAAQAAGFDESSGLLYPDPGNQPTADWQELTLDPGWVHDVNLSVSGGGRNTRYYLGGSFRDEDSFIKLRGIRRYSFRSNIDQKIGDKVEAGISLNPSLVEAQRTPENDYTGVFIHNRLFAPNIEPYDENGNIRTGALFNDLGLPAALFPWSPLVVSQFEELQTTTAQVYSNVYLNYQLLPSLKLRTEFGAEYTQLEQSFKSPSFAAWGAVFGNGLATAESYRALNYNWTNQATYTPSLQGGHYLEATLGMNLTRESFTSQNLRGNDFVSDETLFLNAAANVLDWSSGRTDAAFLGYFARANYRFKNRYLLTLSARYDGSSRFGQDKRFGFFPAVSAGWIVSQEPFFQSGWVNYLKVRSSFGLAGNAAIGNFAARGLISGGANYGGAPGLRIRSFDNLELGWEKNQQWDIAIEFGLLENRVRGSVEYFLKDTRDLLLDRPIAATNGISTLAQNIGAVRNQGVEFELAVDILQGPLNWTVQLNGTTLNNEVRRLVDTDGDGTDEDIVGFQNIIRTGESLGSFYLVRYAGVDPANGDALFLDAEGNVLVNQTPDAARVIAGNNLPAFSGGIGTQVEFQQFDLSAQFQFSTGFDIYQLGEAFEPLHLRNTFEGWRPDNPGGTLPEYRLYEINGDQASTRWLDEGDFIRLRHLQVGYTIENLWDEHSSLRIFLAGQNLWTATRFSGLDPEVSAAVDPGSINTSLALWTIPQPRTITFGFNLSL